MANRLKTIFSLGHSSKPLYEFLGALAEHRIEALVDVRTFPQSRFAPQYNAKPLGRALEAVDIRYLWRGKNMGGRGENAHFDEAISELADMVRQGTRVCVLCMEPDYRRCHRHTLIEPTIAKHGIKMKHIRYDPPHTP